MRPVTLSMLKSSLSVPKCRHCQWPFAGSFVRQYAKKSETTEGSNSFSRYLRRLKWVPIPIGVGFAYIGYQQYGRIVKREEQILQNAKTPEELIAKDWQVKIYTSLPLRAMSRLWGRVNNIELPVWMRSPVLRLYIWSFGCKLEEAAIGDLQHYRNLGEFFKRRLKPGCRPVDQKHSVTSPSDGKILHFGKINNGQVEQVKGVTYTLQDFLGPSSDVNNNKIINTEVVDDKYTKSGPNQLTISDRWYHNSLRQQEDSELYHCVIYLAPGDYHGFHSPVYWRVEHRRHFPGELLSVNPGIARWIKGLFNFNERAVYTGKWQHGFFAMAAVGATNVGSIKVYHDKCLKTNEGGSKYNDDFYDETFVRPDLPGIPMKKGESFGEFNLGSTIVVIFEAPKSFQFKLETGQTIKYGEALGKCL